VLVAVAETGSVDDHAVVEQRPTVGLLDPVSRGTSRTRGLVVPKRRPQEQRGLVTHRRHQRGWRLRWEIGVRKSGGHGCSSAWDDASESEVLVIAQSAEPVRSTSTW